MPGRATVVLTSRILVKKLVKIKKKMAEEKKSMITGNGTFQDERFLG